MNNYFLSNIVNLKSLGTHLKSLLDKMLFRFWLVIEKKYQLKTSSKGPRKNRTFSTKESYVLERICLRARSGTQKMGGQNQSVRPICTQLKTLFFVLYYLNRTSSFHFNVFPCFFTLIVVLVPKTIRASKNNCHTSDASV